MLSVMKEIFSNRNVMVITFTTSFYSFFAGLYMTFWPLYLLKLGATTEIIGILSMISSTALLLFQLPGGILADKIGRRKVIVYGSVFRLLTPIIYLFSTSWVMVIPGLLCSAMASIYMPAFSALITESLPSKRRGAAFGAYRMITMLPRVVTVFLGGVIMDSLGIWEGTRMVLIAVIFAVIIMIVLRYKFITETLSVKERSEAQAQSWKESILELRNQSRTVWAMLSVSCISSFALRLSLPFMVLYAINVIGLSTTEWGVIGSIVGIISMALSFPGGLISDRIGRKPNILLARILSPITTFGMTLAKGFNETLLVRIVSSIGGGLGGGVGGGSGGPAWRALLADVIPARRRGRVFGLMGTFTGMVGAPASWIGGYLWDNYNPNLAFQMSCGLGIIPIFILLFFVKEPKVKEK